MVRQVSPLGVLHWCVDLRNCTVLQVAQDVWAQTFKYLADQKVLLCCSQSESMACNVWMQGTRISLVTYPTFQGGKRH